MDFMFNLSANTDPNRPSLFELIAEKQLRDLLQPALRYVLAFYAEKYPRYLIRIHNSHDELYALLMVLVDKYYLREWGGSFTENFYGLKRTRSPAIDLHRTAASVPELLNNVTQLRNKDIQRSLFVMIVIPYVKAKLDNFYDIRAGGAASRLLRHGFEKQVDENASRSTKLKYYLVRIFRRFYPFVNATYGLATLGFYFAYLFGKSDYHSPWLALIKVQVKRLGPEDYHLQEQKSQTSQNRNLPASYRILNSLRFLLPMSIFLLKFLEWWQESDFARQWAAKSTLSIELPPPEKLPPHENGIPLPTDSSLCPLCKKTIRIPTALSTGYVFCYSCIHKWVEEHEYCPVTRTRLVSGIAELRRIMA